MKQEKRLSRKLHHQIHGLVDEERPYIPYLWEIHHLWIYANRYNFFQ